MATQPADWGCKHSGAYQAKKYQDRDVEVPALVNPCVRGIVLEDSLAISQPAEKGSSILASKASWRVPTEIKPSRDSSTNFKMT